MGSCCCCSTSGSSIGDEQLIIDDDAGLATGPTTTTTITNTTIIPSADIDTTYKRCIIYYSPNENSTPDPVSLSDIASSAPYITVVELSTLHINSQDGGYISLNDLDVSDSFYDTIKSQVKALQSAGKKVFFMLGGADDGSFPLLFDEFDTYYPLLKAAISEWGIDGLDLDIEDGSGTIDNVTKVVEQLKSDFGSKFDVIFVPVASAIIDNDPNGGLSGFNYKTLMDNIGDDISWLNLQFYNGFGSLVTPTDYETCVANGYEPQKLGIYFFVCLFVCLFSVCLVNLVF